MEETINRATTWAGLENFKEKQQKLSGFLGDTSKIVHDLNMESYSKSLTHLQKKIDSDTFKIQILGDFNAGKSTFINSLLGKEILPNSMRPCTAIINEIKYGEKSRAILHFMNPLPEKMYEGIPADAIAHMKKHQMKDVPPLEIVCTAEDIERYVTIPPGMDPKDASAQSPFEKMELYWKLPILKNGVELIDTPGLNDNAVRTQVALSYLPKVDAIIFMFSSLMLGSASELEFLDQELKPRGFGDKDIFCIVNRFDQLHSDRDREIVKEDAVKKLTSYAKAIFYTSAYQGLCGAVENNDELWEKSGIKQVKSVLEEYLTHERGVVKLAGPAKELDSIIHHEVLEKVIPQRRGGLGTDLSVLQDRYNAAKPELEKLETKKVNLEKRIHSSISSMRPDISLFVRQYLNDLPGKIDQWLNPEEYKPKTTVSVLHLNDDCTVLGEEMVDYIGKKLSADVDAWAHDELSKLAEEKIDLLKSSVDADMGDFYVSLDKIKLDISGIKVESTDQNIPWWERVFAGGIGLAIGDYGGAFMGGLLGFSKELAMSLAAYIGTFIVGTMLFGIIAIPVVVIGGLALAILKGPGMAGDKATKIIREKIAEACKEEIRKSSPEQEGKIVESILKNLNKFGDLIGRSLDGSITDLHKQIDTLLEDKRRGEDHVKKQINELNQKEAEIREIGKKLNDFIFNDLLRCN